MSTWHFKLQKGFAISDTIKGAVEVTFDWWIASPTQIHKSHQTMWGIDPVVSHYKPTEPKPLNPLQKFSMYLAQV
jgi:hypothetical protein